MRFWESERENFYNVVVGGVDVLVWQKRKKNTWELRQYMVEVCGPIRRAFVFVL